MIAIGFPVIRADDSLFKGTTAIAVSTTNSNCTVTLAVISGAYTIVSDDLAHTTLTDHDERAVQNEAIGLTATDGPGNMSNATIMIDNYPSDDEAVWPIRRQHNDYSI